ncbi:hypothetical protein PM082_000611 [Marasmius tenuissimus]|nr:hypothetical protein PM082_000611 [Marasmius tenuissimus]
MLRILECESRGDCCLANLGSADMEGLTNKILFRRIQSGRIVGFECCLEVCLKVKKDSKAKMVDDGRDQELNNDGSELDTTQD